MIRSKAHKNPENKLQELRLKYQQDRGFEVLHFIDDVPVVRKKQENLTYGLEIFKRKNSDLYTIDSNAIKYRWFYPIYSCILYPIYYNLIYPLYRSYFQYKNPKIKKDNSVEKCIEIPSSRFDRELEKVKEIDIFLESKIDPLPESPIIKKVKRADILVMVQINGKHYNDISVVFDCDKDRLEKIARSDKGVQRALIGRELIKVVIIPNTSINFIVKEI